MSSSQVDLRDTLFSQFGEDLDRIYEEQEKKLRSKKKASNFSTASAESQECRIKFKENKAESQLS